MKENEKPIPYGLRLVSNQWEKEDEGEYDNNSLWINTRCNSTAKTS